MQSHQWLFLWECFVWDTPTVRMCNYWGRVVLKQMGYDPLSRFCSHAYRVVFKEVQRPDQQRQNCWSTLSSLGSLNPKLQYITQPHMVSVWCIRICVLSVRFDACPFFTAWMIVFFSILIIIPTFHSNTIVVVLFVLETMTTADWLSNHTKIVSKMRTILTLKVFVA